MTTYAIDTHTGDGSQTDFTLSYNYFEVDDLIVKVDNVTKTSGTDYDIVDGSTVRFTSAPANGTTVTVERDTDIGNKKVTFSDGGTIRASDMNNQNDQLLFAVQEASDDSQNALRTNGTFYDAGNDRIANVGTPTASTDATTKAYVDQIETDATQQATNAAASASAALSHKNDAANSASAALASENAAAGSASTAATQAGNAASEAADALTAKNDAETAESNAQGHETNASGYASTAQAQAGIATTQAGIATTQAGNATTQAGNAATSATAAAASATDASDDADDAQKLAINPEDSQFTLSDGSTTGYSALHYSEKASDSAAAAAVSEGNASNAQAAAESARDSALASFDSFDDRYLGAKTSDPTVDNDGNALVAGALYFNSTDGEMKVYNGTSWVDAYADGTTLVSKSGDTMTGNLTFANNRGIIFGDNDELSISSNGTTINAELDHPAEFNLFTNGGDAQLNIDANVAGGAGLQLNCTTTGGHQRINAAQTSVPFELQYGGTTQVTIDADGLDVDSGVLVADSTLDTVAINYGGTVNAAYSLQAGYQGNGGYIGLYGSTYFTGDTTVQHSNGTTVSFASYTSGDVGVTFYNNTFWRVSPYDSAKQRCDARDDGADARLHWYGTQDSTGNTSNFRHAYYTGSNYVNVTAQSSNDLLFGGDILATGNITAYSSDERLKENIQTIEGGLDKVCQLRGVTFDWRDDCEEKGFVPDMKSETGFIAQEVQKVIPDAVVPAPFDSLEGHQSGEDYLTVNPQKVIPVLVEAIKELKAEIEELKNGSTK